MTIEAATRSIFDRESIRTFQDGSAGAQAGSAMLSRAAARAARQFGDPVLSPWLLSGVCRVGEFVLAFLSGLGGLALAGAITLSVPVLAATLLAALLIVGGNQILHIYDPAKLRSRRVQFARVALSVALVSGAAALCGGWWSILPPPSVWLLGFLPATLATLTLARALLGACVRRWNRNGILERRVVLVGGGTAAETFIRALERQPDSDIRICGIFDDRSDRRSPAIVAGYPKLGSVGELAEFARRAHIDMLVVTLPLSAERRILAILKSLWILPIDIRLAASSASLQFPARRSQVGDVEMIDVMDRPLAEWDWIAKRTMDLVVGTLALILLSPIMVATAIAIKLDTPGPVFFRQKRHGFNNQEVRVWKFRSLRHDMADPTARKLVTRNDPRVTRVGRFIRRSSIDELPQLFNVITGELSLVGPRPHAVHAVSSENETFLELVDGYLGRHKVKPGITGWAQMKGWRGEIDTGMKLQKRFEHDLYYIENWSILLDLYILAATPISLLRPQGAY